MIQNKKGQEGSLKTIVFAFILIGLFGFLIVTAVISAGNTYGKDSTLAVGGALNVELFNNSINSFSDNAKSIKENFDEGSMWGIGGEILTGLTGIFGVARDIVAMIFAPFTIISNIMVDVLHVPAIVTNVLLGLLIIGIILAIWGFLKIGT